MIPAPIAFHCMACHWPRFRMTSLWSALDCHMLIALFESSTVPAFASHPATLERQLRVTQIVLGAVVGTGAAALLLPPPAILLGLLGGCMLALVRDSLLAAVIGMVVGLALGLRFFPGNYLLVLLGLAVGGFIGSCLGDWARWLPPPQRPKRDRRSRDDAPHRPARG